MVRRMSRHNVKCSKGHLCHPISYRDNDTCSPVRILNYWYCGLCNKLIKKLPTHPVGLYAK